MKFTSLLMPAAFLLLGPLLDVPALAADCGPLKQLASLPLATGPGGLATLAVTINGQPGRLLLDTAGGKSNLSQAAVTALDLHSLSTNGSRLLSRNGNASNAYVNVGTLGIGNIQAVDLQFMVSPNPQLGANPAFPFDGVLANDLLRTDMDMDFPNGKLGLFSPDHCDGKVVYWNAKVIAVVPFSTQRPGVMGNRDTHIRIPVMLDGKHLTAVIATGAARSLISARTARYDFDVTAQSPGAVPLGVVGGDPGKKVFGHVFQTLSFEGITVNNPHLGVMPDVIGAKDPQNQTATGTRTRKVDDGLEPDLTIGMDILKSLHLYVATTEQKLYITAPAP